MTTVESRGVLEERARKLARPAGDVAGGLVPSEADVITALVLRVLDERIAVPLSQIVEVHRPSSLSVVPGAEAPMIGVIAWRGRVLTVMDLAHGRPGSPTLGSDARVVVLGQGRATFGIYADEVDDVQTIDAAALVPPDDASPDRAGIVRGITPDALVVLDAVALLDRHTTTQ